MMRITLTLASIHHLRSSKNLLEQNIQLYQHLDTANDTKEGKYILY